ncbi:MAG: ABC transporter ATP-binding protein [FCB group bacterium]|jgi:putative ABC transport system ATP-binding protein|nr:ABC transporter ATP-binding protein [FCB group bacterium]
MSNYAVEMADVSRVFGKNAAEVAALSGVSATIDHGARVAIVGPSGSGKTTFLNLAGVLDRPSSGQVYVLGQEVSRFSEKKASTFRREKLGFVFQDDALIPEITVFENVELPLVLLRRPAQERKARVRALMDRLMLSHRLTSFPTVLSGGEKQRVAVARAIVHDPMLLLADEPTSQLDTRSAEAVLQTIEDLTAEKGITVLIATHDPRVYSRFPTQLKFTDGRIEALA